MAMTGCDVFNSFGDCERTAGSSASFWILNWALKRRKQTRGGCTNEFRSCLAKEDCLAVEASLLVPKTVEYVSFSSLWEGCIGSWGEILPSQLFGTIIFKLMAPEETYTPQTLSSSNLRAQEEMLLFSSYSLAARMRGLVA